MLYILENGPFRKNEEKTRSYREKRERNMEEKEKELSKEETSEAITEEANIEAVDEAAAAPMGEESIEKVKNIRLRNALLRAGAALLAAVILLAVTGRSLIDLKKGATASSAIQDEELGAFVKCEIFAFLGFYDAGAAASDEANADTAGASIGEYALVPMSDKFITVHFSKRYLQSAAEIEAETYRFINGEISSFDKYVVVEGTTATLSEEMSTKMYEWFTLNKAWMVEAGVIVDTDDIASYLSETVLEVDVVNSMSETLVFVLAGLAAACVLYIIVELVLMATGFYLNGPKKKKDEENVAEDDSEEKGLSDEAEAGTENEIAAEGDTTSSEEGEKTDKLTDEAEKAEKSEAEEDKQ